MIRDFIQGFHFFLTGFRLMLKPGVRIFTLVPLIINVVVFVIFFLIAKHYLIIFNAWLDGWLPTWLHWLAIVVWLLFLVSFFMLMMVTFTVIANMIAAPFNGLLAEQVELYLTGEIKNARSLYDNICDIPRILGRQLAILFYYFPRAFVVGILFFIPVVQVIAAFVWFLFHAWFMAFTYIDYPSDNDRIAIREMRRMLALRRARTMGFGTGILMATMLPVINLFTIPAAVAGATALWIRCRSHD